MGNKFVDDLEKAQNIITDVLNKLIIIDAKRYSMVAFHLKQGQRYIGEVQKILSTEGDMQDVKED
jgi:hypothetical protein